MIKVEAGQIILEGTKYIICARCIDNTKNYRRILNTDCPDCKNWGVVPNPQYVEACRVLGLEPPETAEERACRNLDVYTASKPEFYK